MTQETLLTIQTLVPVSLSSEASNPELQPSYKCQPFFLGEFYIYSSDYMIDIPLAH